MTDIDNLTHCANREWCNNLIPAELQGDLCPQCVALQQREQAYWLDVFQREPPITEDDLHAYTEPCEQAKREGLARVVGDSQ